MRYAVPDLYAVEIEPTRRGWSVWRQGELIHPTPRTKYKTVDGGSYVRRSLNRLIIDAGAVEIVGRPVDREWFPAYTLDICPRSNDLRLRSWSVNSADPPGSWLAVIPHEYDERPTHNAYSPVLGRCRRQVGWFVCLAWHGRPAGDANNACHRDGNPRNNDPSNLYWGTAARNAQDRHEMGRTRGITPGGRSRAQREIERAERHARELTMTDDELIWGEP